MDIINITFKFVFLLILAWAVYFLYLFVPTSLSNTETRFVIPQDMKQDEIIAKLKEENFIRDENLFNFLAGIIKYPGTIDGGAYMLRHNMTLYQISDTLLNHPYQRWIILVPGLRIEQVAERIGKKFGWDGIKIREFLDNAREGYMYPDTYLFNVDYTGREFAQKMIANFNDHFTPQLQKNLLVQNEHTDTLLKIASLIERESGGDEDKSLIAGIIRNRLNKKMRLQIDASIQYAMGTPADWWPHVKPQDTKFDSPYNTYIIKGLPPGPIANPSFASIKAAIYPAVTECLYYIHDHNKLIHCAKSYEEHKLNIENFLN